MQLPQHVAGRVHRQDPSVAGITHADRRMIEEPQHLLQAPDVIVPVPSGGPGNHGIHRSQQVADEKNLTDAYADTVGTVTWHMNHLQRIPAAHGGGLHE